MKNNSASKILTKNWNKEFLLPIDGYDYDLEMKLNLERQYERRINEELYGIHQPYYGSAEESKQRKRYKELSKVSKQRTI